MEAREDITYTTVPSFEVADDGTVKRDHGHKLGQGHGHRSAAAVTEGHAMPMGQPALDESGFADTSSQFQAPSQCHPTNGLAKDTPCVDVGNTHFPNEADIRYPGAGDTLFPEVEHISSPDATEAGSPTPPPPAREMEGTFYKEEGGIMVFRPTLADMRDFPAYIKYMEQQDAHLGGIAKVCHPCPRT